MELLESFRNASPATQILFSGNQHILFPARIEAQLKKYIFAQYPEKRDDISFNVLLTYHIYGGYSAYLNNIDRLGKRQVIRALHEISEKLNIV